MEMKENYDYFYQKVETSQNTHGSHAESEKRKASHDTKSQHGNVLNDDIPPSGVRLQRNRNTFPKARQKDGPPPPHVFSSGAPDRTVSGENIHSQTFYNRRRGGARRGLTRNFTPGGVGIC